jgi:excisionase family DNA binding protein
VPDRLLTAEDVAGRIGMTPAFVYKLCREGRIPHLRFGRSIRFRWESVERWMDEQENAAIPLV